MKNFIIGLAVGAVLGFAAAFYSNASPLRMGRLLDQDIFYLKNGDVLRGWLLEKNGDSLLIETAGGSVSLDARDCRGIQENYLAKYVKKVLS